MKQLQDQIFSSIKSYLLQPIVWMAGSFLLCIAALLYFISAQNTLDSLQETAFFLKKKQQAEQERQSRENKLSQQLQTASLDYVEKELETMEFLTPEIQKLQILLYSQPNNSENLDRLEFLRKGQNSLKFRQENFEHFDQFQQSELFQVHPVEMNQNNLKDLLARIENVAIGDFTTRPNSPDLLIKNFELSKKSLSSNEDVFEVHLQLIKREMTHE